MPEIMSDSGPDDSLADFETDRRQDISFLAIEIVKKSDKCRSIGIILYSRNFGRDSSLIAFEVDDPILSLCSSASTTHRYVAVVVAAGDSLLRGEQRLIWLVSRYLVVSEIRLIASGR